MVMTPDGFTGFHAEPSNLWKSLLRRTPFAAKLSFAFADTRNFMKFSAAALCAALVVIAAM
jgi:hypothetical protein